MKITIHRGTDQIGGCVTEYEYDGWKLFVDYGEQLPGSPHSEEQLQVEGLTYGDVSKSALLITHYHGDHIGKIGDLPKELPVYIGAMAREIQMILSEHLRYVDDVNIKILKRIKSALTFKPGISFKIGPFNIMPVMMDHSAFDAYAFKIDADGLTAFHTGDFRTHGFRSGKLPILIEKFIGKVDYVVCEATNVVRPEVASMPEYELQHEFERAFKENKYNIVYLSSTNVDRLFAIYHASLKAGRPFYVDAYQKKIMDIVVKRDSLWGKSKLYQYGEYEPKVLYRDGTEFTINDKFKDFAFEKGYVIIARANPRFDNLIKQLPGEPKIKYLSQWKGYVDEKSPAYNPNLAESLGKDFKHLHTSGHCDMAALGSLFEMLKPKAIIPIHTDNPKAFADLFSDSWPVVLLNDGDHIDILSHKYCDPVYGYVHAVEAPSEEIKEISNPKHLRWFSLDTRCVGFFNDERDAFSMLKKIVYAPNRLLGFEIVDEEDAEALLSWVYDKNFKPLHNIAKLGISAGDTHQAVELKAGDKALAVIAPRYNVVLPCEITKDVIVEKPSDKVHIRCLVRVADEWNKIAVARTIPATQLYPYQEYEF